MISDIQMEWYDNHKDNVKHGPFDNGYRVDIFYNYIHGDDATYIIEAKVNDWIVENIQGKYRCIQLMDYIFDDKEDAMHYLLVWG